MSNYGTLNDITTANKYMNSMANSNCYYLNLDKQELLNYFGLAINNFNLDVYINKEFTLLKSIDTHETCNTSFVNAKTILGGTSILIRKITKESDKYRIKIVTL